MKDQAPSLIFVVKGQKEGSWLAYHDLTKAFDIKVKQSKHPNWKLKKVRIMAYRQFAFDDLGTLEESNWPITPDYDELVSASRKVYPFHNHDEIRTILNKELYKMVAEWDDAVTLDRVNVIAPLILAYGLKVKSDHRDTQVRREYG